MPKHGRIAPEEKVKMVEAYLLGEMSASRIGFICNVHKRTVEDWARLYKVRGPAGLYGTEGNRKYTPELKRQAVEAYLMGSGSLRDLCTKYDISDKKTLRSWIKRYNGHEDFERLNSGGRIYMSKGRSTTMEERIEIVSHCIANNKSYGKTIEKYGISYQQVYGWVRKYEQYGPESLADRRGKRKDEASMTEVEKLRAQLKLKEAENLRLQMENDLLKKLESLERM